MADPAPIASKRVLILDGGMGISLSRHKPAPQDFGPGCNEYLNFSRPDIVRAVHEEFLAVGADIIETNTFGGARHILAEHGLASRCFSLNRRAAAIARKAADRFSTRDRPRFVAGSIGPGSRLPSLGNATFEELYSSYSVQVRGLKAGGADLLIVETCQDLLQAKAAAIAALDARAAVIVQFTLDEQGRTLTGSDPAAILAAFEPLPVWAIGLNCGFGPDKLADPVRYLARHSSKPVSLMPNAGLPRLRNGTLHYGLGPEKFAEQMRAIASDAGLNLAGGCCGTTHEHVAALGRALSGVRPRRPARYVPQVSSMFQAQALAVKPKPLICGERTNATGSRAFRDLLLKRDFDRLVDIAVGQEKEGAHLIDLSLAAAGGRERSDMEELASRLNQRLRLPVMLDCTDPKTVEAGLQRLGGRCIVNSVNLEDEGRARKTMELCRRYGAALVCMTIDERGMAMTAGRKLAVSRRLYRMAKQVGLRPDSLFFDFLTFTLASGDRSLCTAARETLAALSQARKQLPGSHTILGVSNVSHGLPAPARRVLNSVFLHRAIKAGLDAAILHAGRVTPLSDIPRAAVKLCDALLSGRPPAGRDPLAALVQMFSEEARPAAPAADRAIPAGERLEQLIIHGQGGALEQTLGELLVCETAEEVIDHHLLPAMEKVGREFERGRMLLPFVLRSAETMNQALAVLGPRLAGSRRTRGRLVIATVRGDIHDIGKNLVLMIASANGYDVVDLGVRQTPEQVLAATRKYRPDAVGLSGLLVESARSMADYLDAFQAAGLRIPVLVGGAALTKDFVERELRRRYRGRVSYCRTALDGLAALKRLALRH